MPDRNYATFSEIAIIQQGWNDSLAVIAPDIEGLDTALENGFNRLSERGELDEDHLLALVESAAHMAAQATTPEVGEALLKRLRRTTYEYLLALDAIREVANLRDAGGPAPDNITVDPSSLLIGAEEVAELSRTTPVDLPANIDSATFEIAPRIGFHLEEPHAAPRPDERQDSAGDISATSIEPETLVTGIALVGAGDAPPTHNTDVDLSAERRELNSHLKKKHFDKAISLLWRLANDVGGRAVAELALDAGDRCRSLGKYPSATNCYVTASRADPIYEIPWIRLAEVCIEENDIDIAVSYLERVARLTRLRGDTQGTLRTYRKIVSIAPHREDILEILVRAQSTGHIKP